MVPDRFPDVVTDARGFTMAELAVVLGVAGVLAALALPALTTHLRAVTLRAGAEEAVGILNGARQLAIRLSTTVCVRNDGGRAHYHVEHCGAPPWTGIGTDVTGNFRLANDLRIGGSDNLCFNDLGSGTATPAPCTPNGTLTVTNPVGGPSLSIVMATTGRLRIQ